ncbi:coiled-coil domain containing 92B [Protopterus annectens]|uniref:coiled-coil domain containing 92B n=1 Tax=Protopterus annectens TaxID=7888 RepID=UPI001CFC0534|nr:coiled-coil domain containing 92B [Protopterus annectens]
METLSLERQIQSMERNIAFLKKEQMELLRDLHLEILRLQKHCTELTCELETKKEELIQEESIEQELEEKCRVIETKIINKEQENCVLKKELKHKEALVAALRSSLRNKERKFLEELKRRNHRMSVLNAELLRQTESAAYLSFKLHAAKQKLHGSRSSNRPSDKPPDKKPSSQQSGEAKPKKRSHKTHFRRSGTECAFERGMVKDSAFSQRETIKSNEELDPMPDPALFLQPRRYRGHCQRPGSRSQVVSSLELFQNGCGNDVTAPGPSVPVEVEGQSSVAGPVVRKKQSVKEQGKLHASTKKTDKKGEREN